MGYHALLRTWNVEKEKKKEREVGGGWNEMCL
jgi:hypothetical protein